MVRRRRNDGDGDGDGGGDRDDDVTVTVVGGPPTTSDPNVRHFLVSGLAERRKAAHDAMAHMRFIQENFVDQQVVKQGLLYGVTQSELAKGLGMSKRDVNRLARFPYMPAGRLKDDRYGRLRDAFLEAVWGSQDKAHEATERCQEYDAEHFEA